MAFTALHIGDLHFWKITLNPMHYLGKRLLGNSNLILRRARKFQKNLAGELIDRICELDPDYVLFSGDFTTTASRREFEQAIAAIKPLADHFPGRVLAVPGNHDRYTRRDIRRLTFEGHFGAHRPGETWPFFLQLEQGFWLIGIDGGTSNGLQAYGRLKATDLAAIRNWWDGLDEKPRRLAVLCHFPAEDPDGVLKHDRGPQFRESRPLLDFLAETAVPAFYLHGHHHYRWLYGSPTVPNVTYLNAGAPMLRRGGQRPDLGFLELRTGGNAVELAVHYQEMRTLEWNRKRVETPGGGEYLNLQDGPAVRDADGGIA